jgi:hypothetical protein
MGLVEFIRGVSSTGVNYLLGVIDATNITIHGGDYVMLCWCCCNLGDQ